MTTEWGDVAKKLANLQREIDAAGMGDPRDREIANLQAEVAWIRSLVFDRSLNARQIVTSLAEHFQRADA